MTSHTRSSRIQFVTKNWTPPPNRPSPKKIRKPTFRLYTFVRHAVQATTSLLQFTSSYHRTYLHISFLFAPYKTGAIYRRTCATVLAFFFLLRFNVELLSSFRIRIRVEHLFVFLAARFGFLCARNKRAVGTGSWNYNWRSLSLSARRLTKTFGGESTSQSDVIRNQKDYKYILCAPQAKEISQMPSCIRLDSLMFSYREGLAYIGC